jgi:hypothetical protein
MKEVAADWRCQSGCSCFSTAGGDIVIAFPRTNHAAVRLYNQYETTEQRLKKGKADIRGARLF